jgi:hypothetical protein
VLPDAFNRRLNARRPSAEGYSEVANQEKQVDHDFISADGFASQQPPAAIWRPSLSAKPIRLLKMAYPIM